MTFSIIALGSLKGQVGVAVATGSTYVADRVPHVRPGVGAVATQGYTLVSYGPRGLDLLEAGLRPDEALKVLLEQDPGRELRQVGIMDLEGRSAVHTGSLTPEWHGHLVGPGYIIMGNLIAGPEVLKAMEEVFLEARDKGLSLGEALIRALEAGSRAGGDLRGERSAALFVAEPDGAVLRLRVDDDPRPIELLRAKWREWLQHDPWVFKEL